MWRLDHEQSGWFRMDSEYSLRRLAIAGAESVEVVGVLKGLSNGDWAGIKCGCTNEDEH